MIKLFEHQRTALAYMKMNESFALFMQQGTGKTIVALSHVLWLLKTGKITSVLVVAPKSALGAWERDLEIFDTADRLIKSHAITLINYDKGWRKSKKTKKSEYDHDWGCII